MRDVTGGSGGEAETPAGHGAARPPAPRPARPRGEGARARPSGALPALDSGSVRRDVAGGGGGYIFFSLIFSYLYFFFLLSIRPDSGAAARSGGREGVRKVYCNKAPSLPSSPPAPGPAGGRKRARPALLPAVPFTLPRGRGNITGGRPPPPPRAGCSSAVLPAGP